MGRGLTAALAAAATVSGAGPALAQEPGVRIDPESPSAKEYAIPLEDARRQADPSRPPSAPVVQGTRSSPLFGAGVTPARSRARASTPAPARAGAPGGGPGGGAHGGSSGPRRRPAGTAGGDGSPPVDESVLKAVAQPGAPPGGRSSTALFLGAGAAVLALGAAGGALLSRRGR